MIRRIAILLAALGLLASPVAAQADTGGYWWYEGSSLCDQFQGAKHLDQICFNLKYETPDANHNTLTAIWVSVGAANNMNINEDFAGIAADWNYVSDANQTTENNGGALIKVDSGVQIQKTFDVTNVTTYRCNVVSLNGIHINLVNHADKDISTLGIYMNNC